jgi:hypothetical protein
MGCAQCPVSFVEKGSHGTSAIQKVKEAKKRAFEHASERTIWIASVGAMLSRVESAERKGETMIGA